MTPQLWVRTLQWKLWLCLRSHVYIYSHFDHSRFYTLAAIRCEYACQ